MIKSFGQLPINKDKIAIFASGYSIKNIPLSIIEKIHEKCYTIFLNYAPCKFDEKHIDCLVWSDKSVTLWLEKFYQSRPSYALITREQAFFNQRGRMAAWTDYRFVVRGATPNSPVILRGKYTLVWLLQLIERFYPMKEVLLFGHDCTGEGKWYDEFTSADLYKRGKNFKNEEKINECDHEIQTFIKNLKVVNCSPITKSKIYPIVDFYEILNIPREQISNDKEIISQ